MRLCLDLQGAQSESRHRGIGRYSLGLARALLAKATAHDVHVALNGAFPATIEPLRAVLCDLLPAANVHVFATPGPVAGLGAGNDWRARVAELTREAFLADLEPDVVHVSSMVEGWVDDAVTSIDALEPGPATATTLYDLIPLRRPDEYLRDEAYRAYYMRKVRSLQRSRLLLAISPSARREAVEALNLPPERVVDIGCGVDTQFNPRPEAGDAALLRQHQAPRAFLFYAGGFDQRKNVHRLIEAYACLTPALRDAFKLVIGGRASTAERSTLEHTVQAAGLGPGAVHFTGAIDDATLAAFYRAATLFVFPSLHEGFGLPVAEAMASGAAVIAAAAPGVRDIVVRADALFDPDSVADMTRAMSDALASEPLRAALREHGLAAARRFSWEACAARALQALEALHEANTAVRRARAVSPTARPRLAFVSPLPPERTGIADYAASLLPALSEHYAVEVVVDQPTVQSPWITTHLPVRDLAWFDAHASSFDRVLYHIGNSPFHRRMIEVLRRRTGIVVLHDFFRTGLLRWQCEHDGQPQALAEALYVAHGYAALHEEAVRGRDHACVTYPACLDVLQAAAGTIVHSRHAVDLAEQWFGPGAALGIAQVPMLVEPAPAVDRDTARRTLGIPGDAFLVVSLGFIAPTKANHRLLDAWNASALAADSRAWLVFVGEMEGGSYGRALTRAIQASAGRERIRVSGFVPPAEFDLYLAAADGAVQLRTGSRGESSLSILHCLAHGLPTIVNRHGSAAEIPPEVVFPLADEFDDCDLVAAFERLRTDASERARLNETARLYAAREHAPAAVARSYRDAIERFAAHASRLREQRLIRAIAGLEPGVNSSDRRRTAEAIARQRGRLGARQWLIDVSVVARTDLRTGIERVVRGVLVELLRNPPPGLRVEPVRDDGSGRYVYARAYASRALALSAPPQPDEPVEVACGDAFLGLDWYADGVPRLAEQLVDWRNRGVTLHFVVYDLLPVLLPDAFPPTSRPIVEAWLDTIAGIGDGIVCISRAVADELAAWLDARQPPRDRPLGLGYFPLAATIADTLPTTTPEADATARVAGALARPAILMVGTVEPRKAHREVLAAFDLLWREGADVGLVIVGKQGWMMDAFAQALRTHAEQGRRLWWFDDAADDVLESLYAGAKGLIAASKGEGFGLPIVEAARHGVPVLARDLAVFREVAGPHAAYFVSDAPADLAQTLRGWLADLASGKAPGPGGIVVTDWAASTKKLCEVCIEGRWHRRWGPRLRSAPREHPAVAEAPRPTDQFCGVRS